jgi:hypothetical protein
MSVPTIHETELQKRGRRVKFVTYLKKNINDFQTGYRHQKKIRSNNNTSTHLAAKFWSLLCQHSIKFNTTIILLSQCFHYRIERSTGNGRGMPLCPKEEDRFVVVTAAAAAAVTPGERQIKQRCNSSISVVGNINDN